MTGYLKLKLMGLITLINVVVALVMGALLFFTDLENYFDWYPAIPTFYWVTSMAMVFFLDSVKRKKGDVTVTTFMVVRLVRFTLAILFLWLYLRFVGEHPRAFGFTLMLFYSPVRGRTSTGIRVHTDAILFYLSRNGDLHRLPFREEKIKKGERK